MSVLIKEFYNAVHNIDLLNRFFMCSVDSSENNTTKLYIKCKTLHDMYFNTIGEHFFNSLLYVNGKTQSFMNKL